jgi:D-sedoheptulose 7-phosphate isomerase
MNFLEYSKLHTKSFQTIDVSALEKVVVLFRETIQQNGVIFTLGNGGSASSSSHAACDFSKGMSLKLNRQVRSVCISDASPTLTAWSNDFDYLTAYSNMVKNLVTPNDLLFVVSGSGNSPNVLNAVEMANSLSVSTVGLIGFDGGKLLELVDFPIHVKSEDMQVVENMHLALIHWLLKSI